MNSTASLLHWTRRMIEIRKRYAAFSVGQFTDLGGSNPTVLSYTLHFDGDTGGITSAAHTMLCVNNLSRFPQPVELDLRDHIDAVPIELTGGDTISADRPIALPADAARPRVLLVRHHRQPGGDVSMNHRRRARSRPRPAAGRIPAAPAMVLGEGSANSVATIDIVRRTVDRRELLRRRRRTGAVHRRHRDRPAPVPDLDRLDLAGARPAGARDHRLRRAAGPPTTRCPTSTSPRLLLEAIDQNRDFGDGLGPGARPTPRSTPPPRVWSSAPSSRTRPSSTDIRPSSRCFAGWSPGPNPDAEIHRALARGRLHAYRAVVGRIRRDS